MQAQGSLALAAIKYQLLAAAHNKGPFQGEVQVQGSSAAAAIKKQLLAAARNLGSILCRWRDAAKPRNMPAVQPAPASVIPHCKTLLDSWLRRRGLDQVLCYEESGSHAHGAFTYDFQPKHRLIQDTSNWVQAFHGT